ncbi:MAG: hypothetical protein ACPGVU_22440 [Limisphaerales bacterium]
MKTKFLPLVAVESLFLGGCASMERAPLGDVPLPEITLYENDSTARDKYREGFKQGYSDYLKGKSSMSTSYHYRSPNARLHGYSDGKLEALRFVKNNSAETGESTCQETYHHENQGWFDKYGDLLQSGPDIKWNGFH